MKDSTLKEQLERQLNFPGWLGRQNFVKSPRAYIAVWQPKVRVIQEIEKFCPELQLLGFRNPYVLECREIPIRISRPLRDVSSCGPELLHGRVRIGSNSCKGIRIEPRAG
jgi:hypothetical protein